MKNIPHNKLHPLIKIYLTFLGSVIAGFLVFLGIIIINMLGLIPPPFLVNMAFKFLKLWVITVAYTLPISILILGLWSIIYKESAIKLFPTRIFYLPPQIFKGKSALVVGVMYFALGLILTWMITGVLLGFCETEICIQFPKSLKFF